MLSTSHRSKPIRSKRVTLAQLAKYTGLATTTICDILNRNASDKYSEETRNQVLRAADDLGYVPVRTAQQLRSGRSGLIGLLLMRDFSSNLFFGRLTALLEAGIRKGGYRMQLAVSDGTPETRKALTRRFQADAIEGLIVGPAYASEELQQHQSAMRKLFPSIFFGLQFPCDSDQVVLDQKQGHLLAVQHLMQQGHRRIACVAMPTQRPAPCKPNFEHESFAALQTFGLADPDWFIWREDDGKFETRFDASSEFVRRWRASDPAGRPTAVICHNDQTAITLLCALQEAGLRVPQDLSVVGFDNLPESEYLVPRLTTVDYHLEQQVELILKLLFRRMSSLEAPKQLMVIEPSLIIRKSTQSISCGP